MSLPPEYREKISKISRRVNDILKINSHETKAIIGRKGSSHFSTKSKNCLPQSRYINLHKSLFFNPLSPDTLKMSSPVKVHRPSEPPYSSFNPTDKYIEIDTHNPRIPISTTSTQNNETLLEDDRQHWSKLHDNSNHHTNLNADSLNFDITDVNENIKNVFRQNHQFKSIDNRADDWVQQQKNIKWSNGIGDISSSPYFSNSLHPSEMKIVHPKAFDAYVKRQVKARQKKTFLEVQKMGKYTGLSWKHQNTNPKPFNLSCYNDNCTYGYKSSEDKVCIVEILS